MAQQSAMRRVVAWGQWVVSMVLLAVVIQDTIIGFRGGRIPIFGYRVRGSVGHGLLWLFIAGSFAIGVYVAVTVGADYLTRFSSSRKTADTAHRSIAEGG